LTAVSCGGPPGHYKVTGKVLCNGKPAEGVDIQFNPKGDVGSDPHIAHATSDESGSFSLECRDGPGALPGEYMVALRLMDYNTATARKQRKRVGGVRMKNYPEDALKGRFSDPKNPQYPGYTASITAGTNELPPFEITLDQKEFNEFFGQ
jgi:5-hydroxyisourate hydrolase-like protein (transthyretin family)